MKLLKLFPNIFMLSPMIIGVATPLTSCSQNDELLSKLLCLDDIDSVTISKTNSIYGKVYIANFIQPIDWQNPSVGTFTQRVVISYRNFNAINVENIAGYDLLDSDIHPTHKNELEEKYNSNYFNVEYRFYGESKPAGLSMQSNLWKYLTYDNALRDFHHINTTLKTIFTNKWLLYGRSKGGQTITTYAMYAQKYNWPEINGYISYVAPMPFNPFNDDAKKLDRFCLTTIGNDSSLGTEKAKKYRDELIKLTDYMLRHIGTMDNENGYAKKYWNWSQEFGYQFSTFVYEHPIYLFYDALCFHISIWQYFWQDTIEQIISLNQMDEGQEKFNKVWEFIQEYTGAESASFTSPSFSYNIQAVKEMGGVIVDFVKLKEKLIEFDNHLFDLPEVSTSWPTTKDQENFNYKIALGEEALEKTEFAYDPTIKNDLTTWLPNCNQNIIQVYGATDPWTIYAFQNTQKPNMKFYIDNINPHTAWISTLDENSKTDAFNFIDSWI